MSLLPDSSDFKNIIDKAQQVIKDAQSKASGSNIGQTVKDKIYASTSSIQATLDSLLAKGGLITQEDVDSLDEQMRRAKLEMLAADSSNSAKKFFTYVGVGIIVFASLWYLSTRKTKAS